MVQDSQALQLQKIEGNPGLLPVRKGYSYRQENKWVIIKILDLVRIYEDLDYNLNSYKDFMKLINVSKPYHNEFSNIKSQVDYIRDSTIEKFKQIIPSQRFKRGLLNPLGSVIKSITGNLDNDDALRYDKLIQNLHNKQNLLQNKITLITKIMDYHINSTEILYNNSLIQNERLRRIELMIRDVNTKENNSIYSTYVLSMFTTFINSFRTIYITLSEIETALALSKVSVLHQSIFNSTELCNTLYHVQKFNNLVYPVSISNLVKIERTLLVKAYIKGNQITFIIEVPLIDNNTYDFYKVYSLPVFDQLQNKTYIIIPEYPFLMVKGSMYLAVSSPCQAISDDDQYLCTDKEIVPYPIPTCTEQLMDYHTDTSLCTSREVHIEDIKTQRLSPSDWIIYSHFNTIMTDKCGGEINKTPIKGTYILKTEPGCEVTLGTIRLRHLQSSFGEVHYKIMPRINLSNVSLKNADVVPIDMKGVNLDDIKHLSTVVKMQEISDSDSDSEKVNIIKVNSVSVATIILYVIFSICILIIVLYKFRNKIRLAFTHRNPQNITTSDGSELKGGGVMLASHSPTVRVNA